MNRGQAVEVSIAKTILTVIVAIGVILLVVRFYDSKRDTALLRAWKHAPKASPK